MNDAPKRPRDNDPRQTAERNAGRAASDLHDSEAWLAAIVDSSDDAIVSKNLEGIITSWNQGAQRIFGYTPEEVIGKPITILIPPDRQDEETTILARIGSGERIRHFETIRRRKDGTLFDVSLTVSPVRNRAGRIVGASKIARDITERKRAEKLVATLASEAEHRAKNVLATVLATVRLSNSDTSDGLKCAIEGRIRALADVHTLFVKSRWAGADVRTLAVQELVPYRHEGDRRVAIEGPDLVVKTEAAQAIAVTLHELATNAAKYGALSVAEGRVRVEWSQTPDERLALVWTEANGPAVKPPTRQGFGTRIMRNMIAAQKGSVEFAWNPDGLVCRIVVPT
jgi:PAS domain S-box-containing protein